MKHLTLALISSVAVLSGLAQNLVPNPSFEEYVECPYSTGEFETQVVGWNSWQITPDYFNSCNNEITGFAGVPNNPWGYQWPVSGNAYASIFTYVDDFNNEREFIASPLLEPLISGQEYYIMYYVSLCDGGVNTSRKCANNNLGLRFFQDPEYNFESNPLTPDNFAHLNYEEVIIDSIQWTLIEGWFTADASYNYLAIGNFFDDENTQTVILNDQARCWGVYYIDNVCVATSPDECDYLLSRTFERALTQIQIFPNPASHIVTAYLGQNHLLSIELFDSNGKKVFSENYNQLNEAKIDVSTFHKGIYIMRIGTNNLFTNKKLLIK